MKTIRYAQLALRDLEEIADYSGRMWGAVQARRYIADIRDHVTGVAKGQAFCQKGLCCTNRLEVRVPLSPDRLIPRLP